MEFKFNGYQFEIKEDSGMYVVYVDGRKDDNVNMSGSMERAKEQVIENYMTTSDLKDTEFMSALDNAEFDKVIEMRKDVQKQGWE